jgi:hypothetical protein
MPMPPTRRHRQKRKSAGPTLTVDYYRMKLSELSPTPPSYQEYFRHANPRNR